jgi:sulfoxide reductase heme-binding subunit YedZ
MMAIREFFNQPRVKNILRLSMHIGAWLPFALLVLDYFTNNLTINPIQAATQRTGRTAITLLTIMLACTPLRTLTGIPLFGNYKKPLGLYAFFYAVIHFLIFTVWDYSLVSSRILRQFVEKPYLWLGLTGLVILTLLALTSNRWWKTKMKQNWKKLHRLVYAAGVIVVFHDFLAQKADLTRLQGNVILPLIYGVMVITLLVLRIPTVKRLLTGQPAREN